MKPYLNKISTMQKGWFAVLIMAFILISLSPAHAIMSGTIDLQANFETSPQYVGGSSIVLSAEIEYMGVLTALGVEIGLPTKWSFIKESLKGEGQPNNAKITDYGVEFVWLKMTKSPITFEFKVSIPDGDQGIKKISSLIRYRKLSNELIYRSTDLTLYPGYLTAVQNGPSCYKPGEPVIIDNSIKYINTPTALGVEIYYPNTWTLNEITGDFKQYKIITPGIAEIVWISPPTNGVIFSYSLNSPTDDNNEQFISSKIKYRIGSGSEEQEISSPSELVLIPCVEKFFRVYSSAGAGGKIEPTGFQLVKEGDSVTFTRTANECYSFGSWSVNGNQIIGDEPYHQYKIEHVDQDYSIRADFVQIEHQINVTVGENGTVEPSQNSIPVMCGGKKLLSFKPNKGYIIDNVVVNGKSLGALDSYLFKNVKDTQTIAVTFKAVTETFIITASKEGEGVIDPIGTQTVIKGESIRFILNPNFGYSVKDLLIDGISVGPRLVYYFTNITQNHTIHAVFGAPIKYYTIITKANNGGAIEPKGPLFVKQGSNQQFSIKPNSGYSISDVKIDGSSIGYATAYTFTDINAHKMIEAIFSVDIEPPVAQFSASPEIGAYPLVVKFRDESTGMIDRRIWDFGDGISKEIQHPIHIYTASGNYNVTLTVKGPGGENIATKSITVNIPPCNVLFTASPTSGTPPLTVKFINLSKCNGISAWTWNFGDGSTSNENNPTYSYNDSGIYSVTLNADNQYETVASNFIRVDGRSISGKVTNKENQPLPGFFVEIWDRNNTFIGMATTNEAGDYTIINLPAKNKLIAVAWPPTDETKYFEQYYNKKETINQATLISTMIQNLSNINFEMIERPNYMIAGKVHDGNGTGLANVEVDIFSDITGFGSTTMTDNNGNYTLSGLIEATDYRVSVWSDSYDDEFYFMLPSGKTPGVDIPTESVHGKRNATKITVSESNSEYHNIDIIIQELGIISGVVRLNNGQPIFKLWVNAYSQNNKSSNGAFTDKDGKYTISGLPVVSPEDAATNGYIIEVNNIGYPYQVYNRENNKENATLIPTGRDDINFVLKTDMVIAGQIMNNLQDVVSNAIITAISSKGKNGFAKSDEAGMYTIIGLSPVSDYQVCVYAKGYPLQCTSREIDLTEDDNYHVDFLMDTGSVIYGKIQKEDGGDVEGVMVNIWSETTQTGGTTITDKGGNYKMEGLDSSASDYIISIWEEGYLPAFYDGIENKTVYHWAKANGVSPSAILNIEYRDLVLKTGFSIRGKVQYNGQPIANIIIEATSTEDDTITGWGEAVSTRKIVNNANFEIKGLGPGNYTIGIHSDQYCVDPLTNILIDSVDIADIIIDVQPYARKISGTIHGLQAGKKIKVNAISFSTFNGSSIDVVGTGNDVTYTIKELKPATDYIVQILQTADYPYQAYNAKSNWSDADLVDINTLDATNIDFSLESKTTSISGNVTFPDGAYRGESVWINAFSVSVGSGNGQKITYLNDAAVSYMIKGLVPSSDYIVSVSSLRYKNYYYMSSNTKEDALLIDTQDDVTGINFDLKPGASISGRIIDSTGSGLKGIKVEARSILTNSWSWTKTDNNGDYIIEGLFPASDFIVEAVKGNRAPYYYAGDQGTVRNSIDAINVSTLSGDLTNIDLIITEGKSICGYVRDTTGKSISGIWVRAQSNVLNTSDSARTDIYGHYCIEELPISADYIVTVKPSSTMDYLSQKIEDKTLGDSQIDFKLIQGYELSGKVTDSSENGQKNVMIELWSKANNYYERIKTKNDGTYFFKGVPGGADYILVYTPYDTYLEGRLTDLSINKTDSIDIRLVSAYSLTGIVKNSNNEVVANASITALLKQETTPFWSICTTNNEGVFSFNNVPHGSNFVLTVRANGYVDTEKRDISSGSEVTIILDDAGTISGRVTLISGAGSKGAKIVVQSEFANAKKIGRTDASGYYEIGGIPKSKNGI